MSATGWSFVLQWSRLGVNAGLFLVMSRYLTLAEIGAFATAFAPVRLLQGLQKTGIGDVGVIAATEPERMNALATLSFALGGAGAVLLAATSPFLPADVGPVLLALSASAVFTGIGIPSEALLRQRLRLRALALRTVISQAFAAGLSLWLLAAGAGHWALVAFVLLNAGMSAAISLALARVWPRRRPDQAILARDLPLVTRLALRDLANTATLPVLQFALGLVSGLPAAGAFQIATRLLGLLDAAAISPLRYLALPRLARDSDGPRRAARTLRILHLTALLACLVYPAAHVAGPELLILVAGPVNAAPVLPLLPAVCLLGLLNALAMPFTQALTAAGHSGLTLARALATLGLSLALTLPLLTAPLPLVATLLPVAAGIVLVPYLARACTLLHLRPGEIAAVLRGPLVGGLMIAVIPGAVPRLLADLAPAAALLAKCAAVLGLYLTTWALLHRTGPEHGT